MQAFTELFEPLRRKIYSIACRLVGPDSAEDVVMDTYLKAWKALPAFGGRSSLSTWLCRIACNTAMDVLRSRKNTVSLPEPGGQPDDAAPEVADVAQDSPDAAAARRESRDIVTQALQQLPEPHRATLLLRYADDLSYTEIAAATNVSLGTVMSRLFYAKRKLRAVLSEYEALNGHE